MAPCLQQISDLISQNARAAIDLYFAVRLIPARHSRQADFDVDGAIFASSAPSLAANLLLQRGAKNPCKKK
jgi:hypothetical protein